MFDAFVDSIVFEGVTFVDMLFTQVPGHEIYVRLVVLFVSVFSGILVSRFLRQRDKSEGNVRAALNSIGDGVIVTDVSGRVVRMNPAAEILTGFKQEAVKGQLVRDVFKTKDAESGEAVGNPVEKVIATGEAVEWSNDKVLVSHDGVEHQIADSAAPVRWEGSDTFGVVLSFRDLTESKQMHEKIRVTEDQLEKVMDVVPDLISLQDSEMNVVYSNWKGVRDIDKEKRNELDKCYGVYRNCKEMCPDCPVRKIAKTEKPWQVESELPDGTWLDIRVMPVLDPNGQESYFVEWVRDITDRKRDEQIRDKLLQELELKNEELESLIYVASHDLRSPLVNIHGFSHELQASVEQLKETVENAEGLSEAQLKSKVREVVGGGVFESLQFIVASAEKMDVLLKGLLSLSRVGRVELKIEDVDMNGLITKVVDGLAYQLQDAGIDLKVGSLPSCMGDYGQLIQVFTNLIDNAIKYRESARESCEIEVGGELDGGRCVYYVSDNGVGIHEDYQAKIFEVFHRLEPDGPVPGEGIGLATVKRIISRLGGKLWIESEEGKGCCFCVSLPAASESIQG
ncbi:PAS domain-containing sensor histidine kinase [Anaerohalosphaera lusitana]|uniref:PAS domain-containing sensor histidine kinase n=1 Tax=Anaerohalosphaera lusitana TaxID=1936003 RepID=UPI0014755CC5|nr:PAS domain-containing sensor histidine kinase [Anaerohalosphaera lusitana]